MGYSEISSRYAKAFYELTAETKTQAAAFSELLALSELLQKNPELHRLLESPMVKAEDKEGALKEALKSSGLSDMVKNFVFTISRKNRWPIFHEIVEAYQARTDAENQVTRGVVKSAAILSPEERRQIEETVTKVLKKKVILTYKEDPTVIGGLTAQVGSYSFDDTLTGHLRRLKEELNRRAH